MTDLRAAGGSKGKGQMVIEMMLISGVGFSVVCGVSLSVSLALFAFASHVELLPL